MAARDVLADFAAAQVEFMGGHAHYGFVRCAAHVEQSVAHARSAGVCVFSFYKDIFQSKIDISRVF